MNLMSTMFNRASGMQGKQPTSSEMATNIISQEDTDDDGMISASESALKSDQFNAIDSDSDGLLTSEELQAHFEAISADMSSQMAPPPPPGPPPAQGSAEDMAASILEQDDTDGDGVISVDEAQCDSSVFKEIDTDGDGYLTTEELQTNFEKMEAERETEQSQSATSSTSTTGSDYQTLLDVINQNQASSAYSSQNWLYEMLQGSGQSIMVNA